MQNLGPYEGLIEISRPTCGSSGACIYKARDRESGHTVALKVLNPAGGTGRGAKPQPISVQVEEKPEPISVERFLQEASILASLDHPNIVKVLPTQIPPPSQPPYFYVMQFLTGRELSRVLQENGGRLPLERFIPIFRQLASALAYIHERGIVHMDVKPNNVFISENDSITLLDFGISRYANGRESFNKPAGTLAYASPEQMLGLDFSQQSDIFSLGALAYEVLSGSPPFTAGSISRLADRVLNEKEKPLHLRCPDISMALSVCIARALSKAPKQRYPDVDSFARDFELATHTHNRQK